MSRRIICLFAVLMGLAGSASAELIVYDGFDYAAGSLGGNAGGIGWDAGVAWDGGQTVSSPGMEYPGLSVIGNKVTSTSTASFRMMPAGFSAANRTLWISFLGQNSATPSWCGISPFMGGSEALFIGKPDTSATWGLALYNAQSDAGGATGSRLSTVPVGDQVFFVVRIINGASGGQITAWLNPDLNKEPGVDTAFYDNQTAGNTVGRVLFDRIRIAGAGQALFYDELRIGDTYMDVSGGAGVGLASEPSPADEASDVPVDAMLSWTAGEFAATHNVYLGTSIDDVNAASVTNPLNVLVAAGQSDSTAEAGTLEFGTTYYWRVDEVNSPPDSTVFKGEIWSFTTEPFAYPITNVAATASSFRPGMGPENVVNGAGLTDDQHSTEATHMWMSAGTLPNWIQFEFDKAYKLDEMLVWNSNQLIEAFIGFGAKTVTVEYSADGETWTALEGVPEFARSAGVATQMAGTAVDFGGAMAKYVKLTIDATWGGLAQAGLAEVRFSQIPVQARAPMPADGAADVSFDAELTWRPGREATSHEVLFGTDAEAMTAQTVTEHSFTPAGMEFGMTYYWQVNEVGDAGTYEGDLWSFTSQEFAPIDDFESYTDDEGSRIYEAWVDGLTTQASGSQVGYDLAPFAEKAIVHGGKQSMPLLYDNSQSPFNSEAELEFDTQQNWTGSGATEVAVWTRGYPAPTAVAVTETGGKMSLTGSGADIWGNSDQFTYAYKALNGDGSMVARVVSIGPGSSTWAKGGVMIRDSLNGGSTHAMMVLTANSDGAAGNGASFQYRPTADAASSNVDSGAVIAPPYWVKMERVGDTLTGYISANGTTWTQMDQTIIAMDAPVYIGLAVTSHAAGENRTYEFDNISSTGGVTGSWQGAVIDSPQYNAAADMYLVVEDSTGKTAMATSATAANVADWTRWTVPMSDLAGVNFARVTKLTIGVGSKTASAPGGTGIVFIDDIGYGRSAATE